MVVAPTLPINRTKRVVKKREREEVLFFRVFNALTTEWESVGCDMEASLKRAFYAWKTTLSRSDVILDSGDVVNFIRLRLNGRKMMFSVNG